MWHTLKNPVGAQGLRPKATFLIKNLLKGDRNFLQTLLKGDHNFLQNLLKGERNSLQNLLKGERNSPLQKKIRAWINQNPNPLTFA